MSGFEPECMPTCNLLEVVKHGLLTSHCTTIRYWMHSITAFTNFAT